MTERAILHAGIADLIAANALELGEGIRLEYPPGRQRRIT